MSYANPKFDPRRDCGGKHRECPACTRLSMDRMQSDMYVCCDCLALHDRVRKCRQCGDLNGKPVWARDYGSDLYDSIILVCTKCVKDKYADDYKAGNTGDGEYE